MNKEALQNYKEKVLAEFNEKIKSPDYNNGFLSDGCEECGNDADWDRVRDFLVEALSTQHEITLGMVEEVMEDYFKGLILILNPQLTKEKLLSLITSLKKTP